MNYCATGRLATVKTDLVALRMLMRRKTKSPSGALNFLKALVLTQAAEGASYISVNIDALAKDDPDTATEIIPPYVKLVRKLGKGVPVCIESKHEEALIAGLQEWYRGDGHVAPPLIGPIKFSKNNTILTFKKQYDFSMIYPLSDNGATEIDKATDKAQKVLNKAVTEYGFRPEQIFFDAGTAMVTKDLPKEPGAASQTYKAFRIIRNIRNNSATKKCHCLLNTGIAMFGVTSRAVGVCRAYVARAMEYGLDAAFADVTRHYGEIPADPKLLELIDAFVDMDGSPEKRANAEKLMSGLSAGAKKPPQKT